MVWGTDRPTYELRYCRIAATSDDCATPGGQILLPPPGGGPTMSVRPHVFAPGGNRVVIVENRCCSGIDSSTVWTRTSTDGGITFSEPQLLAARDRDTPESNEPAATHAADFGPGEGISWIGLNEPTTGLHFQHAAFGTPGRRRVTLETTSLTSVEGTVAVQDGTPFIAWHDGVTASSDDDVVRFRLHTGGDLNSAGGWAPSAVVDDSVAPQSWISLASGPAGLFLVHADEDPNPSLAQEMLFRVRTLRGGSFDAGVVLNRHTGVNAIYPDLTQDAGGTLYAGWSQGREEGAPQDLWYRERSPRGRWRAPVLVAGYEDEVSPFFGLRLGAGGGRKLAVFHTGLGREENVGVTTLDHYRCQADDPRSACRRPRCERRRDCPPRTLRAGGLRLELSLRDDDRRCARDRLDAALRVTGDGGDSVRRVRFTLDGGGARTDGSSPFSASYDVSGEIPLSRHRVQALVTLSIEGEIRQRRLSDGFRSCGPAS